MLPLLTNKTFLIVFSLLEGKGNWKWGSVVRVNALNPLRCLYVSGLYMSGTNQTDPVLVKQPAQHF